MTHDELLDVLSYTAMDGMAEEPLLLALRAVIELHKPKNFAVDTDFPWVGCTECEQLQIYPCPTIETIDKELNNG